MRQSFGNYTRLTNAPKLESQRKRLFCQGDLVWFGRRSVQVQRSRDRLSALAGNNVPDVLGRFHYAGDAGKLQRFLIDS